MSEDVIYDDGAAAAIDMHNDFLAKKQDVTVTKVIIQNQVRCNICGDEPFSKHRHDFVKCKCGNIAVDGGMEYFRRIGDVHNYIDLSMEMNKEDLDKCIAAVKWAEDTGRNQLGTALAVIRALRDGGYLNMGKFQE